MRGGLELSRLPRSHALELIQRSVHLDMESLGTPAQFTSGVSGSLGGGETGGSGGIREMRRFVVYMQGEGESIESLESLPRGIQNSGAMCAPDRREEVLAHDA